MNKDILKPFSILLSPISFFLSKYGDVCFDLFAVSLAVLVSCLPLLLASFLRRAGCTNG